MTATAKTADKTADSRTAEDASERATERAVFKVHIRGTLDQVWHELTKTDEVQKAMFDSRMHTDGLVPGGTICMRSADGKFTGVVGKVLAVDERRLLSHTFRFTTFDDPECTVTYELEERDGGVDFKLICDQMPAGTKTAKQMQQGGAMIVKTLKSVIETGKPPFGVRVLYLLFKLLAPFNPKRTRSENWPLPA